MTKPSASLHVTGFFLQLQRRDGHDATIRQSWYSQEPRCLESPEMDSLDEHVEKISVWQCVTFCEHGQLKGWQPRFQPTAAKSSLQ